MSGLWLIGEESDDEPDYTGEEWSEHVTEKDSPDVALEELEPVTLEPELIEDLNWDEEDTLNEIE